MVGTKGAAWDNLGNTMFSFYDFIGALDPAKAKFKALHLRILFYKRLNVDCLWFEFDSIYLVNAINKNEVIHWRKNFTRAKGKSKLHGLA